VQEKWSSDKYVIAPQTRLSQGLAKAKLTFETLPLKIYRQRHHGSTFFVQWMPDRVIPMVNQIAPDIINLHWICAGFMQIETISKLKRPLVWTLHDMWAFTGGCHSTGDCNHYKVSCGSCPQLASKQQKDLSHWIWWRKAKAWKNLKITLISPSNWLATCASSSPLFQDLRIEVIPHGLDTQKYRPIAKECARKILNLPQDKQLILFGSLQTNSDKNKGFQLLQPALKNLSKSHWKEKLELCIFGASQPENSPDLGFKTHYLGYFHDDISLAAVYSAADVTIVPSLQESFGQTASESLACGTPVVAFNATGLKDIIDHQSNGYLAKPYESDDLAKGIAWVLENPDRQTKLSCNAREKVEKEFTLELQAQRYLTLFQEILAQDKSVKL
ncbi:glycosyltransferase family 4 protein, partial [Calothrix rhizosoleniae]|uniref:glycosyltransferase family 4 protein n=1 Tax=Calothrix rhizosoleniae TaxID=888997 RepID=UPI0011780604